MVEKLTVELGIATYEGDLQTWYSTYVDLPIDTLDEDILDTATETYTEAHPKVTVAGTFVMGTYYTGDEDELELDPFGWGEEDEDEPQVHADDPFEWDEDSHSEQD
jgi:hypothetical protein